MEEGNGMNQEKTDQSKLWNQEKANPANLLDNFSPEKNLKQTQNATSLQLLPEPDLNLRLCLGSIYGENTTENPLTRSSSIAGFISLRNSWAEHESRFISLTRACSLPTVSEQEHRLINIRELQTMRIEAKNRLLQKQRSLREAKEKQKFQAPPEPMPNLPCEVAAWAAASAANSPALCRAILKIKTHGLSPSNKRGWEGAAANNVSGSFKVPSVPKYAEPAVASETISNGNFVQPAETRPDNQYKKARMSCSNFEDNGMEVMRQMPSVSTTGEGPNGRRVEGFLYTYMRGHVCIMCVCHGSFLSPAEFVKHAGGKDVPNPMKHITVYSTFAN